MWPTQHSSGEAVGSRSACPLTRTLFGGRRASSPQALTARPQPPRSRSRSHRTISSRTVPSIRDPDAMANSLKQTIPASSPVTASSLLLLPFHDEGDFAVDAPIDDPVL